jgi:sterol desaturase/sphingolipid hydroxylase (fatty acid hydroxylase superfamily)
MDRATTLWGITQEMALHVFAFDFGRYAVGASLVAGLVWLLRRTSWNSRKIQKREATSSDIRREIAASVRTVLVYVVVSMFVIWGARHGVFHAIEASFGLWGNLGLLAAILLAHDTYFYWAHRAMHHPKLFKTFHRFHHRTVTPTAWAAYSFAIPEAFVMAIFMPIWLFFVPTPGIVIFAFLIVMILRNCMGHAGLELHARGWASHPVLKWISTTTHHDLHHAGSFNHNFGFYFTWWDKLMGTEHPDYVAVYDRVTARKDAPKMLAAETA